MKKFLLLVFLSFLFTQQLFAQEKQGAWWYFGNKAGLNFNTIPPLPDLNGKSQSLGGTATISDGNGNLLFYCDGNNLYNKFHGLMANGTGLFTFGNVNGKPMIVPKPGNPFIYYLFIANGINANAPDQPFTYSEIDMRLDNGRGAVVAGKKNILLLPDASWRVTACLHSNNRDTWVITHDRGNKFYAYLITPSGIQAPIISNIGISHSLIPVFGTFTGEFGDLKSSPNSEMVADVIERQLKVQLFSFDRQTGILNNQKVFDFSSFLAKVIASATFSPNSSKLYISVAPQFNPQVGIPAVGQWHLDQFDLTAGSFNAIINSKVSLKPNSQLGFADMQIGIDGKIYLLPSNQLTNGNLILNRKLSIINCPNEVGFAVNLQDTVLNLNRQLQSRLPALNQTLFRNANQLQVIAERPYICQGESVKLSAFGAGAGQFTWLPSPGLGAINGAEATVQPAVTTTYIVIGTGACRSDTARVTVVVAPPAYVNAGPDQSICSGATVQLGTAPQPGYSYTWHTATNLSDSTIANPTFSVVNTGTTNRVYQFIVTMEGPGATCGKSKDTVRVTVQPQIAINAGQALTTCSRNPVALNPQLFNSNYSYSWSPATGLSNANSFAPTLTVSNFSGQPDTLAYTLTATFNGCSRSAQTRIVVLPEPRPLIYGPASVCPGSPQIAYHVQNPLPGNSYTWGVRGGTISQTFSDSIWVNWGAATATARVWALGRNSFNCPGDTVFFPVLVNPQLQTEKPKGSATLCENDKQNQLYQVARAQGSVYTWGISGGSIVSGQGNHQVRVYWPGPGQYKLWVQESAQTSLAQCYGVSDTLRITVLPSPDNTLAVQGPASVCAQSQQMYSLAGNSSSAYQWQVTGGNIISGQGSNSILINWQTVGQAEVKVRETLANGCAGNWRTLAVLVNPLPQPVVNTTNYFCPEALTQTHRVQGLPGSTFQWQVSGGSLVSGQGSSQAVILWDSLSVSHSFTVTETTAAGCRSAPQQVGVTFDRSALHLLSVGLNEAETQLVVAYALKSPPLNLQNQVIVQVKDSQTSQWQQLGQRPAADTIFQAPAGVFEAQDYRLQFQNTCGNEVYSGVHRPVKLTASGQENSGEVTLSWNPYKGWSGTVRYEVWRQLESQANFEKLTVTTDSSLTLKTGRDGFRQRYRIKAVAANGRESWSQSVGLTFKNELSFPNIITPNNDGLNDFFTAKNLALYPNSSLKIFNRWGQEVFSSADYRGNWQAEGLSSGTYYYLLQTANGKSFKGWVEVVK